MEKTKKKKVLLTVGTIGVAAVIAAGVFAGVYFTRDKERIDHGNQLQITQGAGNGMSLSAMKVTNEENETSQVITATVTPANAVNAILDWSIEWGTEEGSWGTATKGEVTDYVTVTPETDGALVATVACLGEYGTQAIVKASVRGHDEIYAECLVDYVQRFSGASFGLEDSEKTYAWNLTKEGANVVSFPKLSNTATHTAKAEYSKVYSVKNEATEIKAYVAATETYVEALQAAGITGVTAGEFAEIALTKAGNEATLSAKPGATLLFIGANELGEKELNAFKTVLLDHTSSVILSVKVQVTSSMDEESVEKVFELKFDPDSFEGGLVTDIAFDKDHIYF